MYVVKRYIYVHFGGLLVNASTTLIFSMHSISIYCFIIIYIAHIKIYFNTYFEYV